MRGLLVLAMIGFCVIGAGAARGQTVVTACQRDDQQNAGMNLAAAIAMGGRITFQCGTATILITRQHSITRDTEIDGGNLVTLDAQDATGMFIGDAGIRLRLTGLSLTGGHHALPPIGGATVAEAGVVGGALLLDIVRSNISSSVAPILLLEAGKVHIEGSTISGNRGAAITALDIDIHGSRIVNNQGGIVLNPFVLNPPACQLNVIDSEFSNNNIVGNGGAVSVVDCSATIERSSFTSNSAVNGGAIFFERQRSPGLLVVNLNNVKFTLNRASDAGGAIATTGGPITFTGKRLTFDENQARHGGAIHLDGRVSFGGDAVLFSKNTALEGGGGIFVTSGAEILLGRGIFVGNDGGPRGGAVLRDGPRDAPQFVTDFANSLFVRNRASKGAAFLGNRASFINSTIVQNIGEALSVPGDGTVVSPLLHFKNSITSDNNGGN